MFHVSDITKNKSVCKIYPSELVTRDSAVFVDVTCDNNPGVDAENWIVRIPEFFIGCATYSFHIAVEWFSFRYLICILVHLFAPSISKLILFCLVRQ